VTPAPLRHYALNLQQTYPLGAVTRVICMVVSVYLVIMDAPSWALTLLASDSCQCRRADRLRRSPSLSTRYATSGLSPLPADNLITRPRMTIGVSLFFDRAVLFFSAVFDRQKKPAAAFQPVLLCSQMKGDHYVPQHG